MTGQDQAAQRPLPSTDEPDTGPVWRASRDHVLLYQEGQTFPRRHLDVELRASAGRGTIYTFTVIRRHGASFFRDRTPYVVALVDLDEGVRVMAGLHAPPDEVEIGQRVVLGWEDHDAVAVPVFRPTG